MMDKKGECPIDALQLLKAISNKREDINAARDALSLFTSYFEAKIVLSVEIQARKIGYDEDVALEAIQCAFAKVWYYPSFDIKKSRCKDLEKAIIIWLIQIAISQMHQFAKKGECAKIEEEEDLSVIENADGFVATFNAMALSPEQKVMHVLALERKLSVLDEKHKIIYLTYKAYQTRGKKLPRTLLEKMRRRLGVSQVTIRVYKKEACEALNDFELLKA